VDKDNRNAFEAVEDKTDRKTAYRPGFKNMTGRETSDVFAELSDGFVDDGKLD